ncbi:MAG: hypothetical protein K2O11_01635 [Oscillospiraceae bacterium]|nr:hypothetical protein [Oscillospiraceae bacterium]
MGFLLLPLGNSPDCADAESFPLRPVPPVHPHSEAGSMTIAASSKRARFLSLGILLLPFLGSTVKVLPAAFLATVFIQLSGLL